MHPNVVKSLGGGVCGGQEVPASYLPPRSYMLLIALDPLYPNKAVDLPREKNAQKLSASLVR